MTAAPTAIVLFSGGTSSGEGQNRVLNPQPRADSAIYDPRSDIWTPIPAAPFPYSASTAAVWTGDAVLLWGYGGWTLSADGRSQRGPLDFRFARYDPSGARWTVLPNDSGLPVCGRHAVAWTGSEMIVWGHSNFGPGCEDDGTRTAP